MTETHQNGRNIVIIGGVAAGASCAARLRRLDEFANILVLERSPDVSFANCGLPYYIGGEIEDRSKLAVQTPESLKAMLNLDVRASHEVTRIDREQKKVYASDLNAGREIEFSYDALVLAPGANPLRPPIPGIDHSRILTLRNLQDMDRIAEQAKHAKRVTVIGAGFIGLEMAEQLHRLNKKISLVELQNQVLPQLDPEMAKPVQRSLENHGIELHLDDGVQSFETNGDTLDCVLNSGTRLEADLVILSIGVRPETHLAKQAGLDLAPSGHLMVNEYQQTSDPSIYAAGDAVITKDPILSGSLAVPLGGPANRQGRIIADHLVDPVSAIPYPGSLGTAIVRVFDVAAGTTGWNEKRLIHANETFETTLVTDFQHAGYFPGAAPLTVKILYHPDTHRLLGAQAFGSDGVDKRLDVLATALRGRMTIEDLEHLELSYAPPFGSAKDPINMAAFTSRNQSNGWVECIREIPEDPEYQLLDVRPAAMQEESPIPDAIGIPLTELRERLQELDRNRPVATICKFGKLSYFAARILRQHGYKVKTLTGGIHIR